MCSYGANNVIVGLIPNTPSTVGALRMNVVYALIAGCLMLRYTLPGIQFLGAARELGSWADTSSSLFAFYAATALIVNSAWQRELVPFFSLRK